MKNYSEMKGYKEFIESDNEYCSVYKDVITFGDKLEPKGQLLSYNQIKQRKQNAHK